LADAITTIYIYKKIIELFFSPKILFAQIPSQAEKEKR
jgi:hypothetical protein